MSSIPSPHLSISLPFYNEEEGAANVIAGLEKALEQAQIDYELLLVDNGSHDRTGVILANAAQKNPRLRVVTVTVNQGYGHGILQGLRAAQGRYMGYMCADGQVTPENVVAVFQNSRHADMSKVVRISRFDGWKRNVVSIIYNHLFRILFKTTHRDINGTPKIFKREHFEKLNLTSKDWFIDAEIMIKATRFGFSIAETPIEFLARPAGHSNVRLVTIREFLTNIFRYRFQNRETP